MFRMIKHQFGKASIRSWAIRSWATANALGMYTKDALDALRGERSGLRPCSLDLPFETRCGALPDEPPPLPSKFGVYDTRLARLVWMMLDELETPIIDAVARWGPARVAVLLGTSTGGIAVTERAYSSYREHGVLPFSFDFARQHAFHAALELVRTRTAIAGPGYVVSTACSSGAKLLASAVRLLATNMVDAVAAIAVDTLCHTTIRGFAGLELLSADMCKPFSRERNGINIGEGAAMVLLDRDLDADVFLLGVGESSDAHHMTAPDPDGAGAKLAMLSALEQAGMTPADVDHVNAHGTGTVLNDESEARAILAVLGRDVPVASTKGYTGHMLGAGGLVEVVFAIASLLDDFIPVSLGSEPFDATLGITVNTQATTRRVRTVLSNSFAFGGSNVATLLGTGS